MLLFFRWMGVLLAVMLLGCGGGSSGGVDPTPTPTVDMPVATITRSAVDQGLDPGPGDVANGGSTDDSTPILYGEISAPLASGQSVQVLYGDQVLTATVVNDVQWELSLPELANGEYVFYPVVRDDETQQVSESGNSWTLTISKLYRVNIAGVYEFHSEIPVTDNGFIKDDKLTLRIDTDFPENESLDLAIYNNIGDRTVPSAGITVQGGRRSWDVDVSDLADGTNIFGVYLLEKLHWLTVAEGSSKRTVSTQLPPITNQVQITSVMADNGAVANGGNTNDTTLVVTGVSTELEGTGSGAYVVLSYDGKTTTASLDGQNWSVSLPALIKGKTYALQARIYRDRSGRWGPISNTWTVSILTDKKLPHTGITTAQCFGEGITDRLVACGSAEAIALSGAGKQDGMYTSQRIMSYGQPAGYTKTDCVKDNVTGLIWEGKPTSGPRARGVLMNRAEAEAYVVSVNASKLCGFSNWGLPSTHELNTLVNFSDAAKGINTNWFSALAGAGFLSSESSGTVDHIFGVCSWLYFVRFPGDIGKSDLYCASLYPEDFRRYEVRLVRRSYQ